MPSSSTASWLFEKDSRAPRPLRKHKRQNQQGRPIARRKKRLWLLLSPSPNRHRPLALRIAMAHRFLLELIDKKIRGGRAYRGVDCFDAFSTRLAESLYGLCWLWITDLH